jgi:hypothetical protein
MSTVTCPTKKKNEKTDKSRQLFSIPKPKRFHSRGNAFLEIDKYSFESIFFI